MNKPTGKLAHAYNTIRNMEAIIEQQKAALQAIPVSAIECGIECIQMFREKELLDATKHKHRGLVMNEASCEHAAESLQKHVDALRSFLAAVESEL